MDENKKKTMTLLELVTIRLQEIEKEQKAREEQEIKKRGGLQLELPL